MQALPKQCCSRRWIARHAAQNTERSFMSDNDSPSVTAVNLNTTLQQVTRTTAVQCASKMLALRRYGGVIYGVVIVSTACLLE